MIQGYDGRAALDENYLHIKLSAHDTPPPPPPSLMLRHGKMKIIVWVNCSEFISFSCLEVQEII